MVPVSAQFEHGAPKQVELDGHLHCHSRVDNGGQLVGCKHPQRVVLEVEHRDELVVADKLEATKGKVSLLLQGDVVARHHHRLRYKFSVNRILSVTLTKYSRHIKVCLH